MSYMYEEHRLAINKLTHYNTLLICKHNISHEVVI